MLPPSLSVEGQQYGHLVLAVTSFSICCFSEDVVDGLDFLVGFGAGLDVVVHRFRDAAWERADAAVAEINTFCRNGKFRAPQSFIRMELLDVHTLLRDNLRRLSLFHREHESISFHWASEVAW